MWGAINEIINNRKTSKNCLKAIKIDDNEISMDGEIIATECNQYFREVGFSLYNQIPQNIQTVMNAQRLNANSLVCLPTDTHEIIEKIGLLKPSSCIHDIINSTILKQNKSILAPKLATLINECIENGYFPNELKIARIVPIFKDGDPMLTSNYRPINILQSLAKIFEMIIYDRISDFCAKFDLINRMQFGFLKQSSTACAVATIVDHLQTNLDKKGNKIGACVFIDLKKAFDTIPHGELINKLEKYGIRGQFLKLIEDYLRNRKQYVNTNDVISSTINSHHPIGIPQGSNLGPLFFLLYVNDIFDLPLHGKIVLFADDTTLAYVESDPIELERKINSDLAILYNWLVNNKLTMNVRKTKYMLMSRNSQLLQSNIKISINNQTIDRVEQFNFLGINIQNNLKWNSHINNLTRKLYSIAGIITRIGAKIRTDTKIAIYYAMIHSHLSYLAPIYGSDLAENEINRIQTAQNAAIRKFFAYDYWMLNLNTETIYKKYEIMKVREIILMNSALFYYKIEKNLIRIDSALIRASEIHNYATRGNHEIRLVQPMTNMGRNSIINSCARIYNSLGRIITGQESLVKFKKMVKNQILESNGN